MKRIRIKSTLTISPIRHTFKWKLTKDWVLRVDGEIIIIKEGFATDFASVPRFLWGLIPPAEGYYRLPAVLHDWMYVKGYKTKTFADKTFLKFMEQQGVHPIKRILMYWGVRLFGKGSYL